MVEDLIGLQLLLGLVAVTTLVLGVTVSRKEAVLREVRERVGFLDAITGNLPGALFRHRLDPQGRPRACSPSRPSAGGVRHRHGRIQGDQ